MAMLGKTVCYINSSGITLMRWVKTLKEEKSDSGYTKAQLCTII